MLFHTPTMFEPTGMPCYSTRMTWDWSFGQQKGYSVHDINRLYAMAMGLSERLSSWDSLVKIDRFYRDKPSVYWFSTKCRGIMEPYIKDMNGSKESVINGRLNGLFFAGGREHKKRSAYGNERFFIPCHFLINPHIRLFFADFYCVGRKDNKKHNVTLVVAHRGGGVDSFCMKHLVPLNILDNPFLKQSEFPPYWLINTDFWVELFFTEPVNIALGEFCPVRPIGPGRSLRAVKNRFCTECNLNPQVEENTEKTPKGRKRKFGELTDSQANIEQNVSKKPLLEEII